MQEPATFSDVEADILDMGASADGSAQSEATLLQWYREFHERLEDVGAHRACGLRSRLDSLQHSERKGRDSFAPVAVLGALSMRGCMAGQLEGLYGLRALGL